MGKQRWGKVFRGILVSFLVIILGLATLIVVVSASPVTGTKGADLLRNLVGPKPVANLEAIVFTIQDTVHQILFKVEQVTPTAPWEISTAQVNSLQNLNNRGLPNLPALSNTSTQYLTTIPGVAVISNVKSTYPNPASTPPANSNINAEPLLASPVTTVSTTPITTQSSTPEPWFPGRVTPLGTTPGEGVWSPFILGQSNSVLAYRTFLQPDPKRPYVVLAIVALDLSRIRLHFQMGTMEPEVSTGAPRPGRIPSTDAEPGILLAAFNGGFKTVNGHFGVYADGMELIPPIDGMGTIAIYKDGSVRIGEWGTDLTFTSDVDVYRQNCPLMVHNGVINPLVYNNSVNDWGGTISGDIVTFRSGIGISQDGKTFYYFAGKSMSMPTLAKAMQDAGAYQAMQLDINNYYVLFTRYELIDNQLTAVPLLPNEMTDNNNRFVLSYSHDFFYITAAQP